MSKHDPEKYRLYYEAHKAERVAASRAYYLDLTDREQLLQAVHYTNLQPLWATDNIRKSDHYEVADARP